MNLVCHLEERARLHPDRLALVDAEGSVSYGELYGRVCSGSYQLLENGLKKGDVVLVLQPVGVELYVSLLSAFHAGLTVMFVDPSVKNEVLEHCLKVRRPRGFIGSGKAHLLRLKSRGMWKISLYFHTSGWVPWSCKWRDEMRDFNNSVEVASDFPALITFTSGSTGMPKAACRTHGFLVAQHAALSEALNYVDGEVDLVTLPIFTLANLASGLTSILANTDLRFPARADSKAIYDQCEEFGVTRCAGSPAFFKKLLEDDFFPDLKSIYTGGAPVFPSLLERIEKKSPEMNVVTVFGSTEAEPISHMIWGEVGDGDRKMMRSGRGLLVGRSVKATRLRVVENRVNEVMGPYFESDFDSLKLGVGEVGEILVTGDHVLKGYLDGVGDEIGKIRVEGEVWHRTGDAGWVDEAGRVWLVGRCSAVIRCEDDVIYPFGVECSAMFEGGVERCAVMECKGEVVLFVEGDVDTDILLHRMQTLGVQRVKKLENIPVDQRHNAKINYSVLRRLIEDD